MKNKILFLVVVVLALSTTAHAVNITTESLDSAVENIESVYQSISDLTANFTQKTEVMVLGKEIKNNGLFQWKKPGQFVINYSGDQPKQYISDNKKIWVYVPGDTQAEVYTISDKTISKEALEFIRGFGNIKRNFRITGWQKKGARVELTLVPSFDTAPYSRLKCSFGSDNILDKVVIYGNSGNVSSYDFSDIRINTGLDDELFKFKKPSGVKIVNAN